MKNIIYILLIGCTFVSCGKDSSCLKSTGKKSVDFRQITPEIEHIILKNDIDLVITQDSVASVRIEGGENVLPFIRIRQKGNTLEIKDDNKCNFLRSYKKEITVFLSLPNLRSIDYTGHGNITSANLLKVDSLTFETRNGTGSINLMIEAKKIDFLQHTGPSDITLLGKADDIFLYSGAGGWYFCKNLVGKKVHLNHNGTGDMIITATETLLVELTSIGNIDYYGNPIVTISTNSGRGKLRHQN